ncbi:GNAT family N-acetyltransferase [Streptomyces sp. NPDC059076]|uniref:GNAT family N-acetyltransferase n=1 Tax=unclassified Streptomyces TaxID=2593676 RepID=UPI0036949F0A
MILVYERHDGPDTAAQLDAFLSTYEEVYAEPPYNEGPSDIRHFIEGYHVQAQRPGMRLILAREGAEVIAFTYGFLLTAETRWWSTVRPLPPADFTLEDGDRTFAVLELAVRKPWRRRGVAAALHTALLEGLRVDRVTLSVRPEPEAAPAQSAYASWGYRGVGRSQPWQDAPIYEVMVLDLIERG